MANEQIHAYGAQTTVISQTATVASNEIVGGDTILDNEVNNYPLGLATLTITDTFGAAPTGPIDLYMVRGEVNSANDNDTALDYAILTTADNRTSAEYSEPVGSFPASIDEAYRKTITISLLGVKKARFYIHNRTATTLEYATNAITVTVTPFTIGT